ncbi:SWIB complex BAF60b domain-containing protein [Invertebrate iridescent virus 22]|uniref:SWIB complex BAF60b domain-containing protein n=1 Tax=Invertebrate iridescent virus 22 TaxID=345198 RepID=W8W2Q8_9VIRU|nr:SWIB complex BAF60b domain-containing protein [Invertebrate iridescent virus 22]CCV01964.1 SWIB complex BAF60b domain-containing protein [Invertebrate iridescent virus 22]
MFSVAPKQVEPTIVPKKGRKNKEIALEHFNKSVEKTESSIIMVENIIKTTDSTVVEMRKALRNALREIKDAKKSLIKYKNIQYKPKRTRESHNTGLEKQRPISESMALFASCCSLPQCEGWVYQETQKSRYDVTNVLCAYIKQNELRDPKNKTIITPDSKLKELLQVEDDVILKYPTMQKYLKNCFEEVVEVPSSTTEEKEVKRGRKPKETKEQKIDEEVKPKKTTKGKENNPPKDKVKKEAKSKK